MDLLRVKVILQDIFEWTDNGNCYLHRDKETMDVYNTLSQEVPKAMEYEINKKTWEQIVPQLEDQVSPIKARFTNLQQQIDELTELVTKSKSGITNIQGYLNADNMDLKMILQMIHLIKKQAESVITPKVQEIINLYPGLIEADNNASMILSVNLLDIQFRHFCEKIPKTIEEVKHIDDLSFWLTYIERQCDMYASRQEKTRETISRFEQKASRHHKNIIEDVNDFTSKFL